MRIAVPAVYYLHVYVKDNMFVQKELNILHFPQHSIENFHFVLLRLIIFILYGTDM